MDQTKEVPVNANSNCPGVSNDQAGKGSACSGCPNQQLCSSGEAAKMAGKVQNIMKNSVTDDADIRSKMNLIKHKILVLSGKGGVGKSTVSAQISYFLANLGFEVGLLDVDICGPSIPRMMGLEQHEVHSSNEGWQPIYVKENLGVMSIGFLTDRKDDAVIWRGPRKNGLIRQFLTDVAWGELDFLIIDTPPGTSDEHMSIVQYLKCTEKDGALIVTTPQEVALADVRKEISFCNKTNIKIIGVIENMSGFVCPNCSHHCDIFKPVTGGAIEMAKKLDLQVIGQVPIEPKLLLSTEKGRCVSEEAPESETVKIYHQIVQSINFAPQISYLAILEYCQEKNPIN